MRKRVLEILSVCAVVTLVIVLATPIGGILGIAANVKAAEPPSELKLGYMQAIDSLNPYVGLNDASYVFYGLVYDALQVIDNDMQPTPDLALDAFAVPESDPQMVSLDAPYGSIWQYNLTENAVWTDGEPFTADDVVYNINLNAGNYTTMWAYQPYSYWMKYAQKVDDYTVRVVFYDQRSGYLTPCSYAYLMSMPMLPKHFLETLSPSDISFEWEGVVEGSDIPLLCTGPFMGSPTLYQDYLDGDHITLLRNPNSHWIEDYGLDVQFDELTFVFFQDTTGMALALENGQIDAAAFPPQAFRELQGRIDDGDMEEAVAFDGPKITQYWTEVGFCMVPTSSSDLNNARLDIKVRHALANATDKQYIIDQYYLGLAEPGSTLIPPINEFWHYEPTAAESFVYDLNQAAAELEAAGYRYPAGQSAPTGIRVATSDSWAVQEGLTPENTPMKFNMLVRQEYPEEKNIALYLQDQWRKIGINLVVEVMEEAAMSNIIYAFTYDTMLWYWSADIDPNYQLFSVSEKSIGGWSDTAWANDTFEYNYEMSVATLDPIERRDYVYECQKIHYKDTPYIILAYVDQSWVYSTARFDGWGDWAADPGRSVDNFWMGNPLYFDLVPKDGDDGVINWLYVGIGVGAVVAIVAVVILLGRRGRKKESLADESPLGE